MHFTQMVEPIWVSDSDRCVKEDMKYHRLILVLAAALLSGCGQDPVVTAAKKQHAEFVGSEPKPENVAGAYVLSDQTLVPGGIVALGGRQCQLDVHPDGGFSITNYPHSSGGTLNSFISTTGTWQLASVGISYGYGPDPKECWGFRFSGSDKRVDPTAFTGPEQPYGLLTTFGDPDSNLTLRFKKKEHTTTESTPPK